MGSVLPDAVRPFKIDWPTARKTTLIVEKDDYVVGKDAAGVGTGL
jgi:hypothetical protein